MSADATHHIRHTVLIGDDRAANRALAELLQNHGIGTVLVASGSELLDAAQRLHPDLILLESANPAFGARELSRQLKMQRHSRDIPLLFLGAEAGSGSPMEDFGGADYLSRPYTADAVLPRISTYLALRATQKQLQAQNEALQSEAGFRTRQSHLLEMIATNQPMDEVLASLIGLIESQAEGMIATISLLDDEGQTVRRGLAPSLDHSYGEALAGLRIGPKAGSCGTAMYRRRPVIVTDVLSDPLWEDYRPLAQQFGLRACWSTPILAASGKVLGSFAMYYREVRSPSLAETRLLELATHIAGIAIERHETERRISYMARHDTLTGLPNRVLLEDRVAHALARASRNQQGVGVLFIDLDHFKHINDSLGHHFGDRLLLLASARLRACLRGGDTVARLGGDEFVICLPDLSLTADAATVAEKVLHALAQPLELEGREFQLGGSIGISVFPGDGEDAEALMRAADTAMYHAKAKGRNQYQFFTAALNEAAQQRLSMLVELRQALQREEFELYYQPQLSLKNGVIVGAEALLRWRHPERGLVSPAEFIPQLEESGLIVNAGAWVLRQACRQARAWQQAGLLPIQVAVNLSAQQFQRGDIVQTVTEALQEFDLEPGCLELEFTESVIFENTEPVISAMHALKQLGVSLTLDDFGTGYSSLAYLQRFPVDRIKIDQSFISDIASPGGSAAIVRSILDMARHVGVSCVAEGVETVEQMGYLQQLSCAEMQGFLFSPALPADTFANLLHQDKRLELLSGDHADCTLLVADNDPGTGAALRHLLWREGLNILDATDVDAAFALLAQHPVGVIVAGMSIQGEAGIGFLTKANSLFPNLICILLAEADDHAAVLAAINQGPLFKVLTRPWDKKLMVDHIRTAFRWHDALANAYPKPI